MASKYEQLIKEYCASAGVAVPSGFGRNSPGPFAVIRVDQKPPKLVAKTWSKFGDVIYYLENLLGPEIGESTLCTVRILDFKARRELRYVGKTRLQEVGVLFLS